MGEAEQEPSATPAIAPAPPVPRNTWSIAVSGAMDPRQHHPFWYKTIGALSENEAKKVHVAASPFHVQFEAPEYMIAVTRDRWDIATYSEKHLRRIEQVTEKVFQKLSEVPVLAFGVNRTIHADTKAKSVAKVLGQFLVDADMGFPDADRRDCSISYVATSEDMTTNITIGQSVVAENKVGIDYNRHHAFKGTGEYIDLGPEIRKHTGPDWESGSAFTSKLVAKINSLAGE